VIFSNGFQDTDFRTEAKAGGQIQNENLSSFQKENNDACEFMRRFVGTTN
jgi:hypothetical protein